MDRRIILLAFHTGVSALWLSANTLPVLAAQGATVSKGNVMRGRQVSNAPVRNGTFSSTNFTQTTKGELRVSEGYTNATGAKGSLQSSHAFYYTPTTGGGAAHSVQGAGANGGSISVSTSSLVGPQGSANPSFLGTATVTKSNGQSKTLNYSYDNGTGVETFSSM